MNNIYKVIWNAAIGTWIAVSELAKGMVKASSTDRSLTEGQSSSTVTPNGIWQSFRKSVLALFIGSFSFFGGAPAFALDITVMDQASLSSALSSGNYTNIFLGADIALTQQLTVNMANQHVVIDGNSRYGLTVANTVTNGLSVPSGTGTLTLQNMTEINSANYYSMVYLTGSSTAVNVIYNNIDYLGSSQLVFMGALGDSSNSVMTFGNIVADVVVNDRDQEIGEVNKLTFTGRFHVTHLGAGISFQNALGAADTSTMFFLAGADVKIDRTGSSASLTNTGTRAFAYDFADNSAFELIANQNVFSGTNTNRGLTIGTYNAGTGFGSGAKIILQSQATGGTIIAGNAIDNTMTSTTGINNGAGGTTDVVYNLATGSILKATGAGILATKNAANASGIYIGSGASINAGTVGISAAHAGSGNIVLQNKAGATITAPTGMSATNTGTATVHVANQGTINSTTAGIAISSSSVQTVNVNNTNGLINATAGTGINVMTNALLNLIGGRITTTGAAIGLTFAGTSGDHTLADVIIDLNGTGSAFAKANGVNLSLSNVTLNTVNGTALHALDGLTFATSANGRNAINVTGTGSAISVANSELTGWSPAALDINVSGVGSGIISTGGGADLSNANLNINVANANGFGLTVNNGATNTTNIGSNVSINATSGTAIQFLGATAKTLNNLGTINGTVTFNNTANNIITNSGTLEGTLTTSTGNDQLTLAAGSTSNGLINLDGGNNTVTIGNGAYVASVVTGAGDDIFTLNNLTLVGNTYLGALNAGTGSNTLNFNSSTTQLAAASRLQNFANINLNTSSLTLMDASNILTGTVNIGSNSGLSFGSSFNGVFAAALSGTGSATVSNQNNNVTLSANNSGYSGNWTINGGATIASMNNLGSGSVNLGGQLTATPASDNLTFGNVLTGNGTLLVNMHSASDSFAFAGTTGSGFGGTLQLGLGQFALSGNNTSALQGATLQLNSDNQTTVANSGQAIGNLTLNSGELIFNGNVFGSSPTGSITTGNLNIINGTIAVDVPTTGFANNSGTNLLSQDDGIEKQLILANGTLSGNLNDLSLTDHAGNTLSSAQMVNVSEGGTTVANGYYNFALTNGSSSNGVYLNYALTRLDLLVAKTLHLAANSGASGSANILTAQLTGNGNLSIDASQGTAQTLTLTNSNNNYDGTTEVTAGTLLLGSDNALGGTTLLTIDNDATVDANGNSQTLVSLAGAGTLAVNGGAVTLSGGGLFAGLISGGAGSLTLSSGTVTLTGDNSFTGTTTVNGGTLAIGDGNNTGSYAGNIINNAAVNFNRSDSLIYNGAVSGSGSLTQQGTGTLILTGSNSYSGGTTISNGTLQLGNGGSDGTITGNILNNAALVYNHSDNLSNSGVISGSGSLTQNGSGTLTLTGSNSYTGGTTINSGILALTSVGGAGSASIANNSALNLSFNSSTFSNTLTGAGLTTLSGTGITLTGNNSGYSGNWTISGSGTIASMTNLGSGSVNLGGQLTATPASDNLTFGNVLTGNGTLLVNMHSASDSFAFAGTTGSGFGGVLQLGLGQFALSGSNTSTLQGATLQLNSGNVTTVGSNNQSIGNLALNGGTLVFNGLMPPGTPTGIITTNDLDLTSGTVQVDVPASGSGFDNPVAAPGSNLLTQDDGILTQLITANGTVSGSVNNLTLTDHAGNALSAAQETNINEGGITVANGYYNFGLSSGSSDNGVYLSYTLTRLDLLAGETLHLAADTDASGSANILTAQLTGNGNLSIDASQGAAQTLTLTNSNNNYDGTTEVTAGTLLLGSDNALGGTTLLTIDNDATVDANGNSQTLVSLAGAGTLAVNGGAVTLSGGGLFAGLISGGAGSLTLSSGTVTLTGDNSFTGTTTVSGGTLAIGDGSSTGSYAGNIINNAAVNFNRSDSLIYSGAVSGSGSLTQQGAGTLILTGTNSYAGGTTISSGTLQLGNGGSDGTIAGNILNNAALVYNHSDNLSNSGVISGSGSVTQNGSGTLTLTGSNSYTGGTTINSGILALTSVGGAGSASIVNNSALNLSFDSSTFSNILTGTGATTLSGTGITLAGNNSGYSGNWTINGGATIASMNNLGSGSVNLGGQLTATPASDNLTFGNVLTGNGTLLVNMHSASDSFAFAGTTGSGFGGVLQLGLGLFALSGNNTSALQGATLQLNSGNVTTVGSNNQSIGNLALNGGTLVFNGLMPPGTPTGIITTNDLDLTSGTVQVDVPASGSGFDNPVAAPGSNLLTQDDGILTQLITANGTVSGSVNNLTLTDHAGNALSAAQETNINEGGITVANGYYNFALTNGSSSNGVYLNYALTRLDLLVAKTLHLAANSGASGSANILTAQLTGNGNLSIDASQGAAQTLTLTNSNNNYDGTTEVTAGTLLLGSDNALGGTTLLTIDSGATVNANGNSQTLGSLAGAGTLAVNGGAVTLSSGGLFAGLISGGAGSLTLSSGTVTLTGDNSFTSTTTVNGGTLAIGDGNNTGSYAGNIINNAAVNFNRSDSLIYNGAVSGSGSLTQQGTGTLILTGSNSYSGGTTISNGTLQLGNGGSDGTITGNILNNAALVYNHSDNLSNSGVISGSGSVTQNGSGTLTLTGSNSYTGGTTINSGILALTSVGGAGSGSIANNSALNLSFNSSTFSNTLTGAGLTTLSGTGITLAGNNSGYSGNWTISGSGTIASMTNLGTGSVNLGGQLTAVPASGDLTFGNVLTGNGTLLVNMHSASDSFAFAGTTGSGFGGVLQLGLGQFALSGSNTSALQGATLQLNSGNVTTVGSNNQSIGNLALNGGTLVFNGLMPPGTPTGIITTNDLDLTSGTVQVDVPASGSGFDNPVTAPGSNLLAQDDSVLTQLIAANGTMSGSINSLTLTDHAGNALASDRIVEVNEGGSNVANAYYNFGLSVGSGNNGVYLSYGLNRLDLLAGQTLHLAADTDASGSANILTAQLTGNGNLSIDASQGEDETLTLTNSNNNYDGTTEVTAGTLLLGSDNALGGTTLLTIDNDATVDANGNSQTLGSLAGAGTLAVNGGAVTLSGGGLFAGLISGGSGSLTLSSGTVTLTGDNSFTGTTTVSGGTLAIGDGSSTGSYAGNIINNAAVNFNRSDSLIYNGAVSGSGSLTQQGTGTLILTGSNSYSGGTTISSGTLQLGNGGSDGTITGNILNNAALVYNHSDNLSSSGVISGSGSVTQNGSGTLTLTGSNTYTGGTTIATGTLDLASAGGAGSGNIANNSALDLSFNNGSFTNTLMGEGGTTVSGTDITLASDNSSYSGNWTINGSATIASMTNLGSGDVNLSGQLLLAPSSGDLTFGNLLTGNGALIVNMNSVNDSFSFVGSAGSGFGGTLQLGLGQFDLSNINSSVLSHATLNLAAGSVTSLSDNETVGNLTFTGGTLNVGMFSPTVAYVSSVGHLNVDALAANPAALGTVNLDIASLSSGTVTGNFLDQDNVTTSGGIQVVKADTVSTSGKHMALTLQGVAPTDTVYENISDGYGNGDITATYNYMAVSTSNGALLDGPGLYVSYVLKSLETKINLVLNTLGAEDTSFGAQLTGVGNVDYRANDKTITLLNSANDYSGSSLVSSGTLKLGANHVLGETSELIIDDGATVDMNGKSQSIGMLSGIMGSVLNLNGGALTITHTSTSSISRSDGSLTGSGHLIVADGDLLINGSNSDLSAEITIDSGANAQINSALGLGTNQILNDGTLTFSNVNGTFANQLSGTGLLDITGSSDMALSADNSDYTGSINIELNNRLTSYTSTELGAASLVNNGELVLNQSGNENFTNAMTGSGVLTKTGTGIIRINSDYGHTGGTNVNSGTFVLQSSAAALSGNGPVNIAVNATLGGYGKIIGDVYNAGVLAIGDAISGVTSGAGTLFIQGNLINHNMVKLAGQTVGNVLNISGNYSAASDLMLNTILEGDASVTDKLIVQGSTSGNTNVTVNNRGGLGAQTVAGIEVIEVGGSSVGTFSLINRVVAGAYDYSLVKTGNNWYLKSKTTIPEVLAIRPEVGAYLANQQAAKEMFLTSLATRMGDRLYATQQNLADDDLSAWAYAQGSITDSRAAGQIDQKTWSKSLQIGTDILRNMADQNRWHLGVMAGAGSANSRNQNDALTESANSQLDGYNLGFYGTWFADGKQPNIGPYVDSWLQLGWYNNTVKGDGLAEQKYFSHTFTSSVESGWGVNVYENSTAQFVIQPQLQLTYQSYNAESVTEATGKTKVKNVGNDGLLSRLGTRAYANIKTATGQQWQPFVEVNWLHDTATSQVKMNTDTFNSDVPKDRLGYKVGIEGQPAKNWTVSTSLGGQKGSDSYSRIEGNIGLKYEW